MANWQWKKNSGKKEYREEMPAKLAWRSWSRVSAQMIEKVKMAKRPAAEEEEEKMKLLLPNFCAQPVLLSRKQARTVFCQVSSLQSPIQWISSVKKQAEGKDLSQRLRLYSSRRHPNFTLWQQLQIAQIETFNALLKTGEPKSLEHIMNSC